MELRDFSRFQKIFQKDGLGVIATDTLYGLAGSAFSKKAVERIYKLKKRDPKKPLIILISSLADLALFKIKADQKTREKLNKHWPGKVSIIFPCPFKKFTYLHRGGKTLAFRLPAKKDLQRLLKKTGPLVAPTANPQGKAPAKTAKQARTYFGKQVDFYLDQGRLDSPPSTLIVIENNKTRVLRQGEVKITP